MRDLWNLFRGNLPHLEELGYAFEKGGVTLENQPIPWSAECVLIGAVVLLPPLMPWGKGDVELRVGEDTIRAERQQFEKTRESCRLQFRLPVPAHSTTAEVIWRGKSLGQVTLPILTADEFIKKLSLQLATASVRLGEQTVACQTFVTTQSQGLIVTGMLQSPTSLVPLLDLGLSVQVRRQDGEPASVVAPLLSSSQLCSRQALVTVVLPKPRRRGTWQVTWHLGERTLATHAFKAITQKQFLGSLRVSANRFVLQNSRGDFKVERFLPAGKGFKRAAPCFMVTSSEMGMAGKCTLEVRAVMKQAGDAPLFQEQEVLLTDGPFPFVPGTLESAVLDKVKGFELRCGRNLLATLPLTPVPTASFTQEGGFVPTETFEWSASAEALLHERLGKLLE